MNQTNHKIAQESKQKIGSALLTVMEQYAFREITVTQIAQEARLSRKTFYRLFSDKDSVLAFLFAQLSCGCVAQIKARQARHYWDVVQLYFDFFEQRKDLLMLLGKHDLLGRLFEITYQNALEVFEYVRSKETLASFALPLPYMLAYSVGGMHCMLLKWVENGMEIPSSELILKLKAGFMSADI